MILNLDRSYTRRKFAGLAFAVGAAVASSHGHAADPESNRGWIDAHVHVWTADTKRYPLDAAFDVGDMQPMSFTPEELFSHSKPAGVERVVLIQMSFYGLDHSYMLHVMQEHPRVFAGVALIDHRAENVVEQMEKLAAQGMRGFRLHSHDDARDWVTSRTMWQLWRAAGEAGLAICPLINPTDIPFVAALCKKFPDTTVVVDHFARVGIDGGIQPGDVNALCDLAQFPHTYVKTSAFYALGKKSPPYDDLQPMIRRVIDAYGPERLMWASDCPFQVQGDHSYESSLALLRDRTDFLSAADRQWMLRGTAEKVFFS